MAKSAKQLLAEVAEMRAMIAAIPDTDEEIEEAITPANLFKANRRDGRSLDDISEITYRRRVRNRDFNSLKQKLICQECEVTFYSHLPARYDGRLCGENCACIALDKARELLAAHAPIKVVTASSMALLAQEPPHLTQTPSEARRASVVASKKARAAATVPPTLAEKIAASLK